MKRLLVTVAVLALGTAACGKDKKDDAAVTTTTTSTAITTTTTIKTTTTAKAAATTTTIKPLAAKIAADSATPAAGTCGDAVGGYAAITLNPDIPSPRCVIVHDSDQLKITNNTDELQAVDNGANETSLHPHETRVLGPALGTIWAKGVHRLETTLYGDSDPEVWLK
jgi:hypothetical protein